MSNQSAENHADKLISNLRDELEEASTPLLDEPKEGQEIHNRRPSRGLILTLAMIGVMMLAVAVYIVRVQHAQTVAETTPVQTTFTVEGEWLVPGFSQPLELPEQVPLAPPPLPDLLPTPAIDMSSPLP